MCKFGVVIDVVNVWNCLRALFTSRYVPAFLSVVLLGESFNDIFKWSGVVLGVIAVFLLSWTWGGRAGSHHNTPVIDSSRDKDVVTTSVAVSQISSAINADISVGAVANPESENAGLLCDSVVTRDEELRPSSR